MKSSVNGLLVIDKPGGMTSRDLVDHVQGWFPRHTRIGHTGTLDPLATGVLVLCLGVATRLTEYVQRMDKTYRARFLLGAQSDTDDADGTITSVRVGQPPSQDEVARQLSEFVGAIAQVPPAFSAAKVTGRRAYDLARRGKEVTLQPRKVNIYQMDLLAFAYPHLDVEVRCGKGTYIRALARDLGARLGCGAIVEALRRTQVGRFRLEGAIGLDADGELARQRLLPVAEAVAELPRLTLAAAATARLRQGQSVPVNNPPPLIESKPVAVFDGNDVLVAVASFDATKNELRPDKVLSKEEVSHERDS